MPRAACCAARTVAVGLMWCAGSKATAGSGTPVAKPASPAWSSFLGHGCLEWVRGQVASGVPGQWVLLAVHPSRG